VLNRDRVGCCLRTTVVWRRPADNNFVYWNCRYHICWNVWYFGCSYNQIKSLNAVAHSVSWLQLKAVIASWLQGHLCCIRCWSDTLGKKLICFIYERVIKTIVDHRCTSIVWSLVPLKTNPLSVCYNSVIWKIDRGIRYCPDDRSSTSCRLCWKAVNVSWSHLDRDWLILYKAVGCCIQSCQKHFARPICHNLRRRA